MIAEINGSCAPGYENFRDAFQQNFADGLELGASLHLSLNGEPIVDLWGGFTDLDRQHRWQQNSLANVFSSTKIPTICCALRCLDLGLLELDRPVAEYWPEFGTGGKDRVTVRQLMTHRAGVPALKQRQPIQVVADWDRVVSLIAQEPAWFERHALLSRAHLWFSCR